MNVYARLLIVISVLVYNISVGQNPEVCSPNNFTATAGIEEAYLAWENPGIYYGVHEVSPKDSAYYTGTVDNVSSSFTDTSRIKTATGNYTADMDFQEVGWATFDISILPPHVEPLSVDFNFYVYDTNWPYWCVTPVSLNPLTADANDLHEDILEGAGSDGTNDYGSFYETEEFSPGQHTRALVGDVFEDIANARDTTEWFTIGVVDFDTDITSDWHVYLEGWSQLHPPSLTVTYGDGSRHIVPAVPFPGVSNEEILTYKTDVVNGIADPITAQYPEVEITLNNTNNRDDCDAAWAYYVFMDGDTIGHTSAGEFTVENLTIGQEYCFYAISEYVVFDTSGAATDTMYSEESETACATPVSHLLCPPGNFTSTSTYTKINLNWSPPFTSGTVQAWGYTADVGNTPNDNELIQMAAGNNHLLVLQSDSTVYTVPDYTYNPLVPSANNGIINIAAGNNFFLALKNDSTIVGWGDDYNNQIDIPDSISGVVDIATGNYHSLALHNDGTVTAWGHNNDGQSTVPDNLEGVTAVSAGYYHSLVLLSDSTIVGWGDDGSGQSSHPPQETLTNVVAIAAGGWHNLVLLSDSTVVSWGANGYGQSNPPTTLNNVVAIAAGNNHSLALQSDGTVVGWGANGNSQTTIPNDLEGVLAIDAGNNYSVALLADEGEDCGTMLGYTIYEDGDSIALTTDYYFSVTDAVWDQEYCYNVEARYSEGVSSLSDTLCTSLFTPGFCATDTLTGYSDYDMVYLDWPAFTGYYCGTFIGYNIYQDGVPIDTVTQTMYEVENLAYDTDYCFTVTALYEEGEAVPTDTVCIALNTPQLCLPDSFAVEPADTSVFIDWTSVVDSVDVPPAPPEPQANIQKVFGNSIGLNDINNVSNPETRSLLEVEGCGVFLGYTIFYEGDTVAFITDSTSLTITGLENGEEHCFSISAAYEQGSSSISDEICVIPFAVRRDHETGIVQTSITNEGNIGFTDWAWIDDSTMGNGLGFVFAGNNYLFEGGLLVGTSQNQISDCIRNESGWVEEDFVEEDGTYLHIDTTGDITHEEGLVLLNDSGADNPLGIRIIQKSYADLQFETRNGILFHYTLVNENNTDLTGLYAGLFFDWDVMDYLVNSAYYNADHQMVYVQDQEENPSHFAASMLLNVGLGANIDALYNAGDGVYQYSNQNKWMHMNGGVKDEPSLSADVSTYTGIGPVDIAAGDSVSFGIAVLAANSIYELEYVAGELRNFWDTHFPEELGNENEATLPDVFALHQNYPNPFNPVTSIRYDIPEAANVQVSVYSLLGQKVKTLASGAHQPGFYAVQWNGTNDHGSPVASGMYICRIQANRFNAVKKLILMK